MSPPSAPVRVVVADDDPLVRAALADMLGEDDRIEIVGTAADTSSAVRCCVDTHPDVALVDLRMPGGGGAVAAREILRLAPGIRIIGISAARDDASRLAMRRAGASEFLFKGEPVRALVRGVLARPQPASRLAPEPEPAG